MRVLVVDDERAVRESLRRALELEGYEVELAGDGQEALDRLEAGPDPDAVILDVLMPDVDGLEVCTRLRRSGQPAARADADRARRGREPRRGPRRRRRRLRHEAVRARGAARAAARAPAPDVERSGNEVLRFADLELDPRTREVTRGGEPIELTRTEFSLLELFLLNPRQVLTRSLIFERVWGYDFGAGSNSLDVYIGYLRRKTEAGGKPRLIQTVRGVGYALRES